MTIRRTIFIALLLISISFRLIAQIQTNVLYTSDNSQLPSNYVSDFAEDKNGIMWLSTLTTVRDYNDESVAGIVKITPTGWIVYTSENSNLPTNHNFEISLDSTGNIWAATSRIGLIKFDGSNWSLYDTSNSDLPTNQVWNLEVDNENILWMTLPSFNGVASLQNDQMNFFNSGNSNIYEDDVSVIAKRIEQGVVIGTEGIGTVSEFDGSTWTQLNCNLFGKIIDIEPDKLGGFWCSASTHPSDNTTGLRYISPDRACTDYSPGNVDYQFYPSFGGIELDKNDNLWIANIEGLVYFDGENWLKIDQNNSPIPGPIILSMHIDAHNNIWICVSDPIESNRIPALGLFIINADELLSYVTDVKEPELTVTQFQLQQNYPNPFNPSTTIRYSIPAVDAASTVEVHISLKVYDILGNEVTTLVNETKAPGTYEIQFDAERIKTGLPGGVYFYSLSAGNFRQTKKMVLMK